MYVSHYDIRLYYRCPMLLYLTKFGPKEERKIHPIVQQRRKFAKKYGLELDNLDIKLEETKNKMRNGNSSIYQCFINYKNFIAKVNKFRKISNKSIFGDYSYAPEFQGNRNSIRRPLLMEGTFLTYISKNALQSDYNYFLITKNKEELQITIDESLPQLLIDLPIIEEILSQEKDLTPNYTRDCRICEWREYCKNLAKETSDLTLISGIGKKIKKELFSLNINNVESLAKVDMTFLPPEILEMGDFEYFIKQAESIVNKTQIIREKIVFPDSTIELFVDVEGSSHHDFVWVIGCMVRKGTETFYKTFLAKSPQEEEKMIKNFIDYVDDIKHNFTIYHWSSAEPYYFSSLVEKHKLSRTKLKKILDNSFDLFLCFKDKIILPLYSYTLKEVAKWLGFEWFDPMSDGATSIVLFDNWYLKKDRNSLEQAISYNSDDCKALLIIKDYLSKQLHPK